MNVKIITIHAMHNPGSVLQAYALQAYLSTRYDAQLIDYRPAYFYNEGSKLKFIAKRVLYWKSYSARKAKFSRFLKNNMRLTNTYTSYKSLSEARISADVFIVGSDQLWNTDFPCGNDPAFYLMFVKSGKKISFSTSIGKKNIDEHAQKILMEHLQGFSRLSVREESTAGELCKLLGRSVLWTCDPVFLLQKKEYVDLFDKTPPTGEKYVLVYLAPESEMLDCLVELYRKRGYRIVLVGGVTKRCTCDEHIVDAGPEDFIRYIYYAEVVISSSFHATAFSHIFHKEFVTIVPPKNGERIVSLLKLTGLTERAVFQPSDVDSSKWHVIQWNAVDKRLQPFITASQEYLWKAIDGE